MSKEKKEQEVVYPVFETPDGKLKGLKSFGLKSDNRIIRFIHLEDGSSIINVIRYKENEEAPYEEEITNQVMRLSKETFAMLIAGVLKANKEFDIDADNLLKEINKKTIKKQ